MSSYNKNLQSFVQLLHKQRQLFTDSKRQELLDLIEPLPDDMKTLANAISSWSKKYDDIRTAYLETLKNYNSEQQSKPSDQRLHGTTNLSSTSSQPKITKKLLENNILQSQPTNPTPPKTSS